MIAVLLSEVQTLRNYFLTNNWAALPKFEKYLLICSQETFSIISELSRKGKIPLNHKIVFNQISIDKFSKRVIGVLRNFSKSSSTYKNIKKNRDSGEVSFHGFLFRLFIFYSAKVFPRFSKILRLLLAIRNKNSKDFEFLNMLSIKMVITLAITNEHDALLLIAAKTRKICTVSSTRSWDNLSSHGSLLVEPNVFISHSEFMESQLNLFQNMSDKMLTFRFKVPWYDVTLSQTMDTNINEFKINSSAREVLYACTGPSHFSNELDYIQDLEIKLKLKSHNLSILQHPKDRHTFDDNSIPSNVFVFPYVNDSLESTLVEYYSFLDQFDIIIGSGSTVLLDSYYRRKSIIALLPDNTEKYWTHISRYGDYMFHYSQFLAKNSIQVFSNVDAIFEMIEANLDLYNQDFKYLNYFIGSPDDPPLSFKFLIDHCLKTNPHQYIPPILK